MTFGHKLAGGFAAVVILILVMGVVAILSLRSVTASTGTLVNVYGRNLRDANNLALFQARKTLATRSFLLQRDERAVQDITLNRERIYEMLRGLRERVQTPEERALLDRVEQSEREHFAATQRLLQLRRTSDSLDAVAKRWAEDVQPRGEVVSQELDEFIALEDRLRESARAAAARTGETAVLVTEASMIAVILLSGFIAWRLTGVVTRQVGTAVRQVQSSSAELQSVANQQAVGSREQATAMSEISTTINELLATSRQIAESAQRVAGIALQTASSSESGDATVRRATESIHSIRRQVDLVVSHMLELGKKSQQIGGVLDIVSELAEQTNILAINASIEAAGAGEAGTRFSVVADEIRKLADRVAGATKEIRALIEEVRNAVNTTVMVTETGSKAVDSGARQVGEVAAAFSQISGMVATTTEAAREIELSTKQQATAVEQVNVAIANVAQATRENEVSSGQTLQTASQLASLSGELLRLVAR